jgi:RNA polymerase sigma-70 factor (ECF subfamily)
LLDPDVIVRADEVAARMGSPKDLNGADAVARFFNGAAAAAQATIVEGIAGAAWAPNGKVAVLFDIFVNEEGKIVEIEFIADRAHLAQLDVAIVEI